MHYPEVRWERGAMEGTRLGPQHWQIVGCILVCCIHKELGSRLWSALFVADDIKLEHAPADAQCVATAIVGVLTVLCLIAAGEKWGLYYLRPPDPSYRGRGQRFLGPDTVEVVIPRVTRTSSERAGVSPGHTRCVRCDKMFKIDDAKAPRPPHMSCVRCLSGQGDKVEAIINKLVILKANISVGDAVEFPSKAKQKMLNGVAFITSLG
eukprot:gene8117-biopygen3350